MHFLYCCLVSFSKCTHLPQFVPSQKHRKQLGKNTDVSMCFDLCVFEKVCCLVFMAMDLALFLTDTKCFMWVLWDRMVVVSIGSFHSQARHCTMWPDVVLFFLWSPYVIGRPYIFSCCGLFFFFLSFFFLA